MPSITLPPYRTKRWTPRARTGCVVCRKRRIKCDETKPSCMQCVRSKRDCPGYNSTNMAPRQPKAPVTSYTSSVGLPSTLDFFGYREIQEITILLPKLNRNRKSLASDIGLCMRDFAEQMIGHLPALSGRSTVLDLAVKCVAAGAREMFRHNSLERDGGNFIAYTPTTLLESHTAAIASLREALRDHHESLAAETLLAALFICCFESFVVNSRDAVFCHMGGISRIIEHRGPSRFASAVEKDLLRFLAPVAAAMSLANSTPCYLTERKWQTAIRNVEPDPVVRMSRHYSDSAVTILARCAQLIKHASHSGEYSQDLIDEHASCTRVLQGLCKDFAKSYRNWQASVVPCTSHYDALSYMDAIAQKENAKYLTKRNGGFQLLLLLLGRLCVALGDSEAILIEVRTQQLANHVNYFHNYYHKGINLFLSFAPACMVESVLSTASEWRDFAVKSSRRAGDRQWPLPVVDAEIFARWRKSTGLYSEESHKAL